MSQCVSHRDHRRMPPITTAVKHYQLGSAVCGGIYSDRLVSVWSSSLSQNPSTETVKKWENKFTMRRWGDLVPRGQHL